MTLPLAAGSNVISDKMLRSWGTLLASRFGREITSELGFDTMDVELEGPSRRVGVGKRLGPDVFVKYTQEVSHENPEDEAVDLTSEESPERQLLLEYQLTEIFQLQGETGRIDGDDYLNVDFIVEWGY